MTLKVSIGIPAYNEGQNIANLLDHLLAQKLPDDIKLEEIIIVASGCTDNTVNIVKEYRKKNPVVKLIEEKERGGQASATNLIIDSASGEILVLGCADTLPTSEALAHLVKPLENTSTGATVGRALPVNDPETLWGYIAHVAYRWLYSSEILMVDQEGLCAIRKDLLGELPLHAIAVEHYIDAMVKSKGYKVVYVPDAITNTKQPSNLRDFINQRRRNNVLHLQQEASGIPAPHISPTKMVPLIFRSMEPNPKKLFWLMVMVTLWGYTYIIGQVDYRRGRSHKNWKTITSTKSFTTPKEVGL